MSIGRSLAEKYTNKTDLKSEVLLEKLSAFGLESVLKSFKNSLNKISENKNFYNILKIYSSKKLDELEVREIKKQLNISSEVKSEVHVDENILGGVVVYYQGKKWNQSMRGIFERFNEM